MHMRTFGITKKIGYKEVNLADSDNIINKIYEIDNKSRKCIVTIPDGCIDIEFIVKDGKFNSFLCGSRDEGAFSEVGSYDYCFGIRFQPGINPIVNPVTGSLFVNEENVSNKKNGGNKIDLSEVVNARININGYIEMNKMTGRILEGFKNDSFENKVDYFIQICNKRQINKNGQGKNEVDITKFAVGFLIDEIMQKDGAVNISRLVEKTGYSQCYINRIFKMNTGFSVKKYAEIIRLQKSISLLNKNGCERVYNELGYYDQSHFIKSFKRFTMFTPKKYVENAAQIKFM